MGGGKCYIGTSGWSYAHWAKGRFYPKGLKQGEWLGFLAERFDTVEINSSFYRLPKPEIVARWRGVTGARFRFAVKLWRRITHLKRLADGGLVELVAGQVNGLKIAGQWGVHSLGLGFQPFCLLRQVRKVSLSGSLFGSARGLGSSRPAR